MMLRMTLLLALVSSQTLFAIDSEMKTTLIQNACEARKNAYTPYSKYYVGAALLSKDGRVFLGNNIENAAYGLTCCAERTAIFKAISEGVKDFEAIAVVTKDAGSPCGACRQVLNEFSPNITILIGDASGNLRCETTLDILLPDAFGPHNLK